MQVVPFGPAAGHGGAMWFTRVELLLAVRAARHPTAIVPSLPGDPLHLGAVQKHHVRVMEDGSEPTLTDHLTDPRAADTNDVGGL